MKKQTKIVLGVIVIVAIVGGIWYYNKNKKISEIKEEIDSAFNMIEETTKLMYEENYKSILDETKNNFLFGLKMALQNKKINQYEYNELVSYINKKNKQMNEKIEKDLKIIKDQNEQIEKLFPGVISSINKKYDKIKEFEDKAFKSKSSEDAIELAKLLEVPESKIIKNIDAFMKG
jgi:Fe2+ transport system protein B